MWPRRERKKKSPNPNLNPNPNEVREAFDVARMVVRSSRIASPAYVDAFAVVRTCAERIEEMLAAGEPQVVDPNPNPNPDPTPNPNP